MALVRGWLSGLVGVLAGVSASSRWVGSTPGIDRRAQEQNRGKKHGLAGDSRYGAWLTETVTYHH